MKKYISYFLGLIVGLLLVAGCDEEATLTRLEPVAFAAAPEASASSVTVTNANLEEEVISFTWAGVEYPVDAPVTYSLQFATPADTVGQNAWENAITKEYGEEIFSAILNGQEINDIAAELGLEPQTEGNLVVRVKSYLDRAAYSAALPVKVTPLKIVTEFPALYIAGDFQGWNIGAPAKIVSVNDDGIYEGYIFIPAGGTNEFKLYAQPNWEPTSYGDGGDGNVIVANYAGSNFKAPTDGYYLFSVNLNTMKYLLMKTTWSILGGSTPGGWDADTQLTYDPAAQVWKVTADMKKDGSFKFRANNAWALDFGHDDDAKLAYANHPWKEYVDRPQFTVPSDGNYTLTLDLHEPGNYTYVIQKN
jgi:starch-binding outer membrane protein SusE/F